MSEAEQRAAWRSFDGAKDKMVEIAFGPDHLMVAGPTVDAWRALADVLAANGYEVRSEDTHGYASRNVKGTSTRSLHAFGIAIDVNARTNPMRETPNRRLVRFSQRLTQDERAEDVRLHRADTDMTRGMIDDVFAIRTRGGQRVFGWGGTWKTRKDPMHFHIDVSPTELATGIDLSTVQGKLGSADIADHDFDSADHGFSEWGFSMATEFDAQAPWVMAQLIKHFSLTDVQAAGILGNLGAESGLRAVQEARPLKGRGGFGWAQWTGPRRVSFERWCQENRLAQDSREANYGYLRAELSGVIPRQDFRGTIRALQRATTVEEATQIFEREYEKAALDFKRMGARIRFANRALELYRDRRPDRTEINCDAMDQILAHINQQKDIGDLTQPVIKGLQEALVRLNYPVGQTDGIMGPLTRSAILSFQFDQGLDPSGQFDATTIATLNGATVPRGLPSARAEITADDLRKLGSVTVKNADRARYASWATGALGAAGLTKSAVGSGSEVTRESLAQALIANQDTLARIFGNTPELSSAIANARPLVTKTFDPSAGVGSQFFDLLQTVLPLALNSVLPGAGGSIAAILLGLASNQFANRIIDRRVEDQRLGLNLRPHG